MITRTALAAVLSVVLLAGCTGSPKSAEPSPSPSPSLTSVPQVVAALGCTYAASAQAELEQSVAESGTCLLPNGNTVVIRRFSSDEALGQWQETASAAGTDPSTYVIVGMVSIEPNVRADLAAIKAALAGTPIPSSAPIPSSPPSANAANENPEGFIEAWQASHGETTDDEADTLLDLGRSLCEKLDEGATVAELTDVLLNADMSQDEASTMLAASVTYLCPRHADKVTAG